jgi:hypothetical protein
MTVEDLYYCHKVYPRYLQLIGVFTGVTRSLPRELCQKVGIQQLAQMQFQIKSHHLQRISDSMMRANKYVGPGHARTWQYLMGRDLNADLQTEQSEQPDYIQPGATDQVSAPVDIYRVPDNELAQPSRKTRSGRAYSITSSLLPKPILRHTQQDENFQTDAPNPDCAQTRASARAHHNASLRGLLSPPVHLGTVSGTISRKQDDVSTKTKKTLSWDKDLTIRYQILSQDSPQEDIQQHRQVCIDHEEVRSTLNPVTYVMTSAASLDASVKEFFYQVFFSHPMASNTIQEEEILYDIYD